MVTLAHGYDFGLVLGHVNHHLRPEADQEEAFCREFAAAKGLPFYAASLDPARRKGESVEAWARRERYEALENMHREVGADWTLTAHHADDQVETVLMRLVQRAPFLSLAGIRPRWGKVLRPLLSFTRERLHEWAVREKLEWVEDPSNVDRRFLRNRLRHEVVASMVADDPGSRDTLLRLAGLAQEYEARCTAAAGELAMLATEGSIPGSAVMPVAALLAVEEDIFKLVIQNVMQRRLGIPVQLSTACWHNFRHFVRVSSVGKVFELPHSVRVLLDRGRLVFYHTAQAVAPQPRPLEPGRARWGYHDFLVTPRDRLSGSTGLWLRSWRSGDRAKVAPGHRPRLVSDIYIDARLTRLEKIHWPLVVTEQEEVIWVPGLSLPRNCLDRSPWRITWQTRIRRK